MPTEHGFTPTILEIITKHFGKELAEEIFGASELVRYLNEKTKSASKGSKSRGSFASLYAVFVLVEDYHSKGFEKSGKYREYEGAVFTDLHKRQRELPFGKKLQNHALNHRMNQEFKKLFPTCDALPILRDTDTKRYWINEKLLQIRIGGKTYNLSEAVLEIVNAYVKVKRGAFEQFIEDCEQIQKLSEKKPDEAMNFVAALLKPNVDARIFEIVSFSILKEHFNGESIFWGWSRDELQEEILALFKTGRCNANDGGIDFVMRPLGRFFQVTETTDVKKYFLDIDKVQRYPVTFVVKSDSGAKEIHEKIQEQAEKVYNVKSVVKKYMDCVEEIINIPILTERFSVICKDANRIKAVVDEVLLQSRVEFNYE